MWRYDGGGIERFADNLLQCSDFNRVMYDVVLCGDVNILENQLIKLMGGGKIFHLPLIIGKSGLKSFLNELKILLSQKKYDIVHSNLDGYNHYVMRMAYKMKVPIRISHTHSVGSCQNLFKLKVQQILMRLWATDCIACSLKSGSYWYGSSRFYNVIHCGLDTDSLAKSANQHKSKNEILIVGRICKEKNPFFIVEIMKELVKRNPNVHFSWCGDGELLEPVNKAINEYGLESSVKMVGYTNNVTNYYNKASYLLMPSLIEGLGLSVIEAQIAGLYVFASEAIPEETNYARIRYLSFHQNASTWAQSICDEINQNIYYELNKDIFEDFDKKIIANKILNEIYKC